MSQELSDAEWLRNMADIAARFQDMRTMGSVADIARLRSIADRLERPGVEGSVAGRGLLRDNGGVWHVPGIGEDISHNWLAKALGCDPEDRMKVEVVASIRVME